MRNLAHAKAWNALHAGQRLKVGCFKRRDAVQFYKLEKARLRQRVTAMKHAVQQCNGTAFVTFRRLDVARRVALLGLQNAVVDGHWKIHQAPPPSDIIHANLHIGRVERILRLLAITLVLTITMVFFTTPVSLLAIVSEITNSDVLGSVSESLSSVLSLFGDANTVYGFLASTLMVCFTFFIPRIMSMRLVLGCLLAFLGADIFFPVPRLSAITPNRIWR